MLHVRLDEGNCGSGRYTTSYCPNLAGTLAGCVSGLGLDDELRGMVNSYTR